MANGLDSATKSLTDCVRKMVNCNRIHHAFFSTVLEAAKLSKAFCAAL